MDWKLPKFRLNDQGDIKFNLLNKIFRSGDHE
jgi:hypothetical protein